MSKPYFSILVPVYNMAGKMDICLDSIKAQTFTDYEVVFVDDGSTDGSYDMLCGFAKEDARYRVYRHDQNRSLLAARYTGMEHAEGRYFVYLDSDDYIDADMLEVLHGVLEENPVDIVRIGMQVDLIGYKRTPYHSVDPLAAFLGGKEPPSAVLNVVSAEVGKKAVSLITPRYCNSGEDTFMSGTLYSLAKTFTFVDRAFYHYTIDGGMSREKQSLNMAKLNKVMESLDNVSEGLEEFLKVHNPSYVELARKGCETMYRYEICHFLLNAADERQLIDFLNRFQNERTMNVFDYGCREILPEYFKRRLGVYAGDKMKFNGF